ncbi:hypothetical protein TNCV_802531 [Trichonephila clavipes]|nr:hypothetical protein TNCV_802531 [Trichonephila clavipes]
MPLSFPYAAGCQSGTDGIMERLSKEKNNKWGKKERCGSPVVKVSDHGRHVKSSSPVHLKTRRIGTRCTLNLSRAQTSSRWCDVVVRRVSE